jgi:hypothetical protein
LFARNALKAERAAFSNARSSRLKSKLVPWLPLGLGLAVALGLGAAARFLGDAAIVIDSLYATWRR